LIDGTVFPSSDGKNILTLLKSTLNHVVVEAPVVAGQTYLNAKVTLSFSSTATIKAGDADAIASPDIPNIQIIFTFVFGDKLVDETTPTELTNAIPITLTPFGFTSPVPDLITDADIAAAPLTSATTELTNALIAAYNKYYQFLE